jgi:hypothetical protein
MAKPYELLIQAYNVGFGDCFLLTFRYHVGGNRHVLIDFGTKAKPARAPKDLELQIAKEIKKACQGKLDAIVVTHRHRDHLSGFRPGAGRGPGDIIRSCAKTAMILQPWTEDPKAASTATAPTKISSGPKAFVQSLRNMQQIARFALEEAKRMDADAMDLESRGIDRSQAGQAGAKGGSVSSSASVEADERDAEATREDRGEESPPLDLAGSTAGKTLRKELAFLAALNEPENPESVKNLRSMSTPARHRYLYYGSRSGLEKVLPGVTTYVLGPPTTRQKPKIVKSYRKKDETEYWLVQARAAQFQAINRKRLFPKAETIPVEKRPRSSRWFVRRLRGIRAQQLLELVRSLDKVINNTSLILLFQVGKKKILFPGDAQVENWEFALKEADNHARVVKLLSDVHVYKVGHHGSLNATPRTSLWDRFENRNTKESPTRLKTILSTKAGTHAQTNEVPRKKLVDALREKTSFVTTQKTKPKKRSQDVTVEL